MRSATRTAATSAIVALIVAGCGSSSKPSSTAASSPPASTTQPATTPATTGTTSTAAAVLVTSKHTKLGATLGAGPKRLTVYLFEADKAGSSSCTGACASVWPPVTGTAQASGAAMSADLGTITRPDGTKQVTYKGHPLYYYVKDIKDGDAGDTYGEALKSFGAEWYALAPSGKKIDKS